MQRYFNITISLLMLGTFKYCSMLDLYYVPRCIIRPRRSRSAAAYCRQTFPWTICRSVHVRTYVRACVGPSVGLPSALWKNGGSDPDAVWNHRSDGCRDEARSGISGSVHGKMYFWGRIWGAPLVTGTYRAYVCYSAATQPSCQITLG